MKFDEATPVDSGAGSGTVVSFEALETALAALRRKRFLVVASCILSAMLFSGFFVALGMLGTLKPAVLAYGVGAVVLVMDLGGAVALFVIQGRAIDALRRELMAKFPGMPIET